MSTDTVYIWEAKDSIYFNRKYEKSSTNHILLEGRGYINPGWSADMMHACIMYILAIKLYNQHPQHIL